DDLSVVCQSSVRSDFKADELRRGERLPSTRLGARGRDGGGGKENGGGEDRSMVAGHEAPGNGGRGLVLPSTQRAYRKNQRRHRQAEKFNHPQPFDSPPPLEGPLALGGQAKTSDLGQRGFANCIRPRPGLEVQWQLEEHLAGSPGKKARPLVVRRRGGQLDQRWRRAEQLHSIDQLEELENCPAVFLVVEGPRQR